MRVGKVSRRAMKVSTIGVAVLLVVPTAAKALSWDIFSVIDSTISKDIGGALQSVNSIQNSLRQDEQQLLFPVRSDQPVPQLHPHHHDELSLVDGGRIHASDQQRPVARQSGTGKCLSQRFLVFDWQPGQRLQRVFRWSASGNGRAAGPPANDGHG